MKAISYNHVSGIDGLKTGWTSSAGYNLTATMKKDGMRLISVMMGEPTADQRNYDTVKLLNYSFSQYQFVPYKSDNFVIGQYQNYLYTPQKVNFVNKKGEQLSGVQEQYTFTNDKNKIIPVIKSVN